MICRYDQEFIPPLSARENTYQSNLVRELSVTSEPTAYFHTLAKQSFLLALVEDIVVGFMSFRPSYICFDLNEDLATTYVTTVIVAEEHRGKGITSYFYKNLEKYIMNNIITTRTWSTNFSHIRILQKFGFHEIKRVEDGRGKGIDTVYYQKIKRGSKTK